VKSILSKYILSTVACRRNLCNEDLESKLICDTDSDDYVEDIESAKDEVDFDGVEICVKGKYVL
jgi:hypothetical protein